MAFFNFFSHGTQDLYPTFLKMQHGFDPHLISIIAIFITLPPCSAVFSTVRYRNVLGVKAIMIAAFLALPVLPLWAFSSGSFTIGLGAFLMQFMVQGAWGVVPTWLNELVPANARAVLPGFVYQLGNLLASVNATLQARIAETHGGNYGLAMAIVAGAVAILICVFVAFGRETRESSSPVQIATHSRAYRRSSHVNTTLLAHTVAGSTPSPSFSRPFNEQQRLMMASAFRDHYNHRLLFSL